MADEYDPGRPENPSQHFAPWNDAAARGSIATTTTSSPHAVHAHSDSQPLASFTPTMGLLHQPIVKPPVSQQPKGQKQQAKSAYDSGTSSQERRFTIWSSPQISMNADHADKMARSSDMSLDGTAATPPSDNEIDVLDKYAFDFNRVAYDHQVPVHFTSGVTLNVGKLHKFYSREFKFLTQSSTGVQTINPRLMPHDDELAVGSPTASKCVWVGMLLSRQRGVQGPAQVAQPFDNVNGEGSLMKPAKKPKPSGSTTDLNEDDIKILPFNPNALRVVTKKFGRPVKTALLHALGSPDGHGNLCQGFRVPYEDVFFFKEFRDDDATSFSSRQMATKAKIVAQVSRVSAPNEQDSPATAAAPQPSKQAPAKLAVHSNSTGDVVLDGMMREIAPSQGRHKATRPAPISASDGATNHDEGPASDAELHKEADRGGRAPSPEISREFAVAEDEEWLSDILDEDLEELEASFPASVDSGDKQADPKHAVPANDASYKKYEDEMINKLLHGGMSPRGGSVHESATGGKDKGKRKCVAFETGDDQVVHKRVKVAHPDTLGHLYSDGNAGDGDKGGPSTSTPTEAAGLASKLTEMVKELQAHGDIAALRQGYTLLGCLLNRSSPPKTAALGLYLNIPTDGTSDAMDYPAQLKELLVRIPPPSYHPFYSSSIA